MRCLPPQSSAESPPDLLSSLTLAAEVNKLILTQQCGCGSLNAARNGCDWCLMESKCSVNCLGQGQPWLPQETAARAASSSLGVPQPAQMGLPGTSEARDKRTVVGEGAWQGRRTEPRVSTSGFRTFRLCERMFLSFFLPCSLPLPSPSSSPSPSLSLFWRQSLTGLAGLKLFERK